MKRAYKVELKPNNKQRGYLGRCAGAARFIYNWALADRIAHYEKGNPTNYYEQKKRFNELKHDEFPWLQEIPYKLQDQAFRDLDTAYQHFFRRIKNGEKPGFPKFKSKHRTIPAFTLRQHIHIEYDRIRLPCIGWVRFKEKDYVPTEGVKIFSVAISERASRWYASVQVEEPDREPIARQCTIGIDVGIKSLAVCSDGITFENPKALAKYAHKLKRLQRELSRRKKGGANWRKTEAKIARTHQKIANVRKHALHQVSHYVTAEVRPNTVVVETLNIKGMQANHRLAQAIGDASMSELHRQIGYKAEWGGIEVVRANRWYASSKTCSGCGCIKSDLTLADRTFKCLECGLVIDRDLNAAKNLAALGEPSNGRGLPVELERSNALQ